MRRFEYLLREKEILEDLSELDELGNEGWELVLFDYDYTENVVFKRELNEESKPSTPKGVVHVQESQSYEAGHLYEDANLVADFKGAKLGSFLFGGDAYSIKFLLENKSAFEMKVSATEVVVNGFLVEDDVFICSSIPARRKTVDFFNIPLKKLNECDVFSLDDIYSFELRIKYEIEDLDIERESTIFKIELFEVD